MAKPLRKDHRRSARSRSCPSVASCCEDVFASWPDVIVAFDRRLRIVALNPAALQWLPADTRLEDVMGRSLIELFPQVLTSARYEQYLEVLKTKQPLLLVTEPTHPLFGARQMLVRAFPTKKGLALTVTEMAVVRQAVEYKHPLTGAHTSLSRREYDVFLRLAAGQSQRQIAQAIGLSAKTVNTYRRRLLKKLGMKTDAELTRYAVQHKLL